MADVHGTCDERFSAVREALARNLDGDELGASVAVDLDGETVVDLWGGYRDEERTTPWTQDTIIDGWSTTKTVLSLAALMLVDRGELDVNAPVADYWPEFAAKGKKNIEVRHLMAHTSGVSGWDPPFSISDMYDWDASTQRLAAQAPWWEQGTASGYHANNQGHLVGEVIRRITGTTFIKFVAEEIAGGVKLLSPRTIDLVFDQQSDGVDLVLGERFRFGIGFCLGSPLIPYVPDRRTVYWSGWGGSLIVVDFDRGLTISYLMNRMAPGILGSDRAESYVRAVYDAAG